MLNPKQQAFAEEYLKDRNATRAAIRAGYSAKTAGSQGFDLLKKPEIAEYIKQAHVEVCKAARVDAAWVLTRLSQVAETCMQPDNWDPSGANRALELLGKNLKLFTDKTEVEQTGALADAEASLHSRLAELTARRTQEIHGVPDPGGASRS